MRTHAGSFGLMLRTHRTTASSHATATVFPEGSKQAAFAGCYERACSDEIGRDRKRLYEIGRGVWKGVAGRDRTCEAAMQTISATLRVSQMRTVPSASVETTCSPVGLKAMELHAFLCP